MAPDTIRVATYNIHKGVQGIGPAKRLEIHDLGLAIEQLDADFICLQEVRSVNRREALRFATWPEQPQAEFLAPLGYQAVYTTNAITKHGEHGNALLSRWPVVSQRHEDMSDHRFEQRGLLHVEVRVHDRPLHVIVVHLGLLGASRLRQVAQLQRYIAREIPPDAPIVVAGDFNDWGVQIRAMMAEMRLKTLPRHLKRPTFPSRLPVVQLDHIYSRGLRPGSLMVPQGKVWARMSDHLPLIGEFSWRGAMQA
ncbi:endonuclease [Comamonas serinivorans]|uniref:Endonuclease n=2 Tax=Comamonas serinivorans TaxID=1082851 RepID=A0A1Y0ETZ7_9BURK|nr:endonuclease [Comamonas serinivorans]